MRFHFSHLGWLIFAAGSVLLPVEIFSKLADPNPVPSESFMIMGLGLATALVQAGNRPGHQWIGRAAATCVALFSLLSLVTRAVTGASPGVLRGPLQYHSIVLLVAGGIIFCDVHTRNGIWIGQTLTMLAACAVVLGFMGYGIGHFYPFYGETAQNIIPLWTLCCLAVLCVAVFLLRPNRGFMRLALSKGTAGVSIRRLIPVPFVFPFALGMLNNYAHSRNWYSATIGGWLFSLGNIVGYCVAVWWCTERVFLADRANSRNKSMLASANVKLHAMNDELEQRVRDRTRALTEANEILARTNAELEQFAFVASHDLQEPLRNVRIYSQLFSRRYEKTIDEQGRKFLDVISDGAARMGDLVTDLLVYSQTVHQEFEGRQVDLNEVVQLATENCRSAVQETGALVEWEKLPVVHANELQMVQVFQNLLSNSIKYCKRIPPVVSIDSKTEGQDYIISFRDNGIGIAPEYHERIFSLFKRLHKNQYPGTGVGLTLCRRIVQQHGGKIWLQSETGSGTTFFISLPATQKTQ